MIGKIVRGQSFSKTLNYIFGREKQAQLVWSNVAQALNSQPDISALTQKFVRVAQQSRTEKPVYHVSFSPHENDVKKFTLKLWNRLASEFLECMGLKKHQAVAVVHNDTFFGESDLPRPHLHLVVNAVNLRGKCANFLLGLS